MEYVSAIKNDIFPFVTTWMDLPRVYCAELNKSDRKDKPYDFIFMWNLKHKIYRSIDSENMLMVARRERDLE